ncbi:MAG: hypothetical protein UZ05_CHB002002784 [Chlorobi bacterium OLB5]|nr:MAG: hypothetical protein UZ05_CHB002002784 [Chlorobi bacterium OLB5]
MERLNSLILKSLLIILFLSGNIFAQQKDRNRFMIVRSAPSFILNVNSLLSISALELGGVYNSDFHSEFVKNGESFGTRNGAGISITSKIKLHKSSRIWFTQSAAYNNLQSYLFTDGKTNSDNGSASYNCFTGSMGVEYNLFPNYNIVPFIAAELNASIISGELNVWTQTTTDPYHTESYDILSSFRMGFGLSAGTNIMLSNRFGLNLNAKYSYLNLFFRSSEGSSTDKVFRLRDDKISEDLLFSGKKRFTFFFYWRRDFILFRNKRKILQA